MVSPKNLPLYSIDHVPNYESEDKFSKNNIQSKLETQSKLEITCSWEDLSKFPTCTSFAETVSS